jgi:transposase
VSSPRGPHGHWKTSTFLAGLRADRVVAPVVLAGAINGTRFRTDVEPFLAPSLRPGDTVVIEPKATRSGTTLGGHKVKGVREAIEAVGARLLFLPPCKPGPEPDRAVLRQAQGAASHRRPPHHRCTLQRHRHRARRLQPRPMPQPHRQLRLFTLAGKRL